MFVDIKMMVGIQFLIFILPLIIHVLWPLIERYFRCEAYRMMNQRVFGKLTNQELETSLFQIKVKIYW
jgi:hypothetical protein